MFKAKPIFIIVILLCTVFVLSAQGVSTEAPEPENRIVALPDLPDYFPKLARKPHLRPGIGESILNYHCMTPHWIRCGRLI